MYLKKISVILVFVCAMLVSGVAYAVPQPPSLEQPIVDETGTLTAENITAISQAINNNDTDNRSQIAVYMTSHLPDGQSIEEASLEVARDWNIGSTEDKNGVLVYIAKDDKEFRIEVADRAGEYLTDNESRTIQDNVMKPEFKKNDFAQGIENGVSAIREELNADIGTTNKKLDDDNTYSIVVLITVIGIILIVIALLGVVSKGGGRGSGGSRGGRGSGGSRGGRGRFYPSYYSSGNSSSSHSSGSSSFGGGGGFSGGGSSSSW